ncbi:hypothetical protein BGZ95_003774 [Linnemannia exigua]|uniref:AB hydrolase-1 domain-containing protein n=1 Tax=Linnemannia exigua TaxID=604196 RepID=A0AAD4D3S8_9FUNG|nr:hypothetical protein BGZ95_003774 [Linnemannia exigua]
MTYHNFNHKYAIAGGHKHHYADERNPTDPVLLLIHGFPDLWYGWRHQIKIFADKRYRVIVIDCLGYGETDSPQELNKYSLKSVAGRIKDLLNVLEVSEDLDYLAEQFKKTGFKGPLNYYKTGLNNHVEEFEHLTRNKDMSHPVYLIKVENDPVLIPELAVTMPYLYKSYFVNPIQTGHFAILEKPEEFNEVIERILDIIHK